MEEMGKRGKGKVSYTQMTGSHRADGSTPHGRNFTELRGADLQTFQHSAALGLDCFDYSTLTSSDSVLVQCSATHPEGAAPPQM